MLETEHDEDGDIFILSVVRPGLLGVACGCRHYGQAAKHVFEGVWTTAGV